MKSTEASGTVSKFLLARGIDKMLQDKMNFKKGISISNYNHLLRIDLEAMIIPKQVNIFAIRLFIEKQNNKVLKIKVTWSPSPKAVSSSLKSEK